MVTYCHRNDDVDFFFAWWNIKTTWWARVYEMIWSNCFTFPKLTSTYYSICLCSLLISWLEPKAQVSYSHIVSSVRLSSFVEVGRKLFTISISFPEALVEFFTQLGMKYSRPHKCCCFSTRSVKGWIHGGAKCAPEWLLLRRTASSDWLHR